MFTHVKEFVYTNPLPSNITGYSTQVFTHWVQTMQWKGKDKENSLKMQPIKVKIMKIKASWGPLKVWKPRGSIPCSPLLVGLANWKFFNHYHYTHKSFWPIKALVVSVDLSACDIFPTWTDDHFNRCRYITERKFSGQLGKVFCIHLVDSGAN